METTRHFTATVYVVHDAATALHHHDRLGMWLPPGGHLHRDELPHEAAIREAREETGLEVTLTQSASGPRSESARPLPQPETILLEDINVHEDGIGHQHIDFIYYGESQSREIKPIGDEEHPADEWEWVTIAELEHDGRFDPDVTALGIDAIQTVSATE